MDPDKVAYVAFWVFSAVVAVCLALPSVLATLSNPVRRKSMNFTIGHDSEFFASRDGKIISAIGLVGGTKCDPLPLEHGSIQEDNVLIEVNSIPAASLSEWLTNCQSIYDDAVKHVAVKGLEIITLSSYLMDKAELQHPMAQEFGCEPDYDAWSISENEKPDPTNLALRTAGGHVHIGVHLDDPMRAIALARYMDITAGLGSVRKDTDLRRKQLYGKAGALRLKPYGVEYRTLSNFWYASAELREWIYKSVEKAVDMWEHDKYDIMSDNHHLVAQAINTGDVDLADNLMVQYGVV